MRKSRRDPDFELALAPLRIPRGGSTVDTYADPPRKRSLNFPSPPIGDLPRSVSGRLVSAARMEERRSVAVQRTRLPSGTARRRVPREERLARVDAPRVRAAGRGGAIVLPGRGIRDERPRRRRGRARRTMWRADDQNGDASHRSAHHTPTTSISCSRRVDLAERFWLDGATALGGLSLGRLCLGLLWGLARKRVLRLSLLEHRKESVGSESCKRVRKASMCEAVDAGLENYPDGSSL